MAQTAAAIPTLPETLSNAPLPAKYDPTNPASKTVNDTAYNSK